MKKWTIFFFLQKTQICITFSRKYFFSQRNFLNLKIKKFFLCRIRILFYWMRPQGHTYRIPRTYLTVICVKKLSDVEVMNRGTSLDVDPWANKGVKVSEGVAAATQSSRSHIYISLDFFLFLFFWRLIIRFFCLCSNYSEPVSLRDEDYGLI